MKPNKLLFTALTSFLLLCLFGAGFTACVGDQPTADTDTNAPADTDTEAPDETLTEVPSEEETAEAETEPFLPDPTFSVPRYDAALSDLDHFPISFEYDDKEYAGFAGFTLESETHEEIERGIKTTMNLRHPEIPALFCLEATVYPAETAYEYVVYITNDGETNTGKFTRLWFNLQFEGADPVISGIKGDAQGKNYDPYVHDLSQRSRYSDVCTTGRPSHGVFPYYNLSYGNGGTFIAIGWPGNWAARFNYSKSRKITTLEAGQNVLNTYLEPGETIRTPLMGFVDYEEMTPDEQTNAWRHYFINDVLRKIDGELYPIYTGVSQGCTGNTTNRLLTILNSYYDAGVEPEFLWLDAGWYFGANGESVSWPQTGSMDMDTNRFPDRMANIGQFCKDHDMRMMIWFEPESIRLDKDAFLAGQEGFKEEWFLPKAMQGSWLEGYIMNLTDPECVEWVFHKICKVIDDAGATGFRSDFNCDPASSWAAMDWKYPDRKGMTENLYVQGYLSLWDKLIERYPGIYMDSCASGGGRNDLETMKRGVPLHYTDWFDGNHEDYDMKGRKTQSLFAWFPYFKNEIYDTDNMYKVRMNYAPLSLMNFGPVLDKNADWTLNKQGYAEFEQIRDYFYADYYPLVEWTADRDRWNAWEFYDPATSSGYASVFCHQDTKSLSTTVKLKGLDPEKSYRITDFDGLVDVTANGKTLMESGIPVTVPEKPYAIIMLIKPAE
ncbi:MAG: alpha-galactosidase [Clostridia bacterium]|nr:alpha-galactosidase [Clostridia bacterium]